MYDAARLRLIHRCVTGIYSVNVKILREEYPHVPGFMAKIGHHQLPQEEVHELMNGIVHLQLNPDTLTAGRAPGNQGFGEVFHLDLPVIVHPAESVVSPHTNSEVMAGNMVLQACLGV